MLSTLQTIQIGLHFPAQSTLSDKHYPIELVSSSDSRFKESLLFGCNEEDVGRKVAGSNPGAGKVLSCKVSNIYDQHSIIVYMKIMQL